MAIQISKTLQGTLYTELYIVSGIDLHGSTSSAVIKVRQEIYQTKGYLDDGFTPFVMKRIDITDANAIIAINALMAVDGEAAIQAVEQFLINSEAYYDGGVIVE